MFVDRDKPQSLPINDSLVVSRDGAVLRLLRVKRAEKQTVLWNEKPMLDFRNFFPALFLELVEPG